MKDIVSNADKNENSVDSKVCRKCGRTLPVDSFRKTKARGSGTYKTKQGCSTICRNCESLNMRAHNALKNNDEPAIENLRAYYQMLSDAGRPPITAAARRILGLEPLRRGVETNALLIDAELLQHATRVRNRTYCSFDEADVAHKRLADALREAGMYEEINDLMDEWYMEG